ncbi:RcnB family protein [uncultured Tepidimonas sp.]|uniref:RcnB family protein n=1 Tax=uncultured Tepidimonas sp. TaxID=453579 RepID=UPI00260E5053|nr:RcnB family protein [uncultured Tepidimonas sp.]
MAMDILADHGHLRRVGLALAVSWVCAAAPGAWAAKPEWAGHGKPAHATHPAASTHDAPRGAVAATSGNDALSIAIGGYFGDRQREAVRLVFGSQIAQGHCPPGLAKKNNGCRPPGLAKAWTLGKPLPPGVVTYPLPKELQRRLGDPPPGYRFVRVAADILLIAIGTAIVVDAIEDLAGL